MWKEAQVAERMSPVSAADVGTVAVITVSGLIGPDRTFARLDLAAAQLARRARSLASYRAREKVDCKSPTLTRGRVTRAPFFHPHSPRDSRIPRSHQAKIA